MFARDFPHEELEMGIIGDKGSLQTSVSTIEILQWKQGSGSADPIRHKTESKAGVGWGGHLGFSEIHDAFVAAALDGSARPDRSQRLRRRHPHVHRRRTIHPRKADCGNQVIGHKEYKKAQRQERGECLSTAPGRNVRLCIIRREAGNVGVVDSRINFLFVIFCIFCG